MVLCAEASEPDPDLPRSCDVRTKRDRLTTRRYSYCAATCAAGCLPVDAVSRHAYDAGRYVPRGKPFGALE